MRAFLLMGLGCVVACATAEDDGLGPGDSGLDASGGTTTTGGKGGTGGGKGGTGGYGATGGTSGTGGFTGGSGGVGASGGLGATGGLGGADAGDSGPATGFGSCVTQADFDAQGSNTMGFCNGLPFACIFCSSEAKNAGDIVCSPLCICAAMPPICSADAGADADADAALDADATLDAGTDADASDASAD